MHGNPLLYSSNPISQCPLSLFIRHRLISPFRWEVSGLASVSSSSRVQWPLNFPQTYRNALCHLHSTASQEIVETSNSGSGYVEIGFLSSVHGLQGDVCVKPSTDFPFSCQVWFLEEEKLPIVSNSLEEQKKHKILLESPWQILQSPVGSGGVISSLSSQGILEDLADNLPLHLLNEKELDGSAYLHSSSLSSGNEPQELSSLESEHRPVKQLSHC